MGPNGKEVDWLPEITPEFIAEDQIRRSRERLAAQRKRGGGAKKKEKTTAKVELLGESKKVQPQVGRKRRKNQILP
jgi:hypothetical protein